MGADNWGVLWPCGMPSTLGPPQPPQRLRPPACWGLLWTALSVSLHKKIQCMSQLITAVRNTGSTNHTGKHRTALSQAASMAFKQSTTLPPDCIAACRASYSLEYLRSRLAAW